MSSGAGGPLRIGIDVRYLSHALVGGVHTYVTRLVPELFRAGDDCRFVVYADAKAPLELRPPAGVEVRTLPWRHAVSSVWNDETLARPMAADGIDVAFFPTNYGFGPGRAASVVTVHDAINLLPLRQTLVGGISARALRRNVMTAYLHQATVRAVRRATRLVTLSGHGRQAIADASTRLVADIDVVHHGAPPRVPVTDAEVRSAAVDNGISGRYLLADGLKNPDVILRAARRWPEPVRRSVQLVFFARRPDVLPELQSAIAAGEATLLVRPSSKTLAALYTGAAVFAFPSWIEGFGIPLLEAMTYGAPIVASDRGSIPEVAGDAAFFVDAEDDASLADVLVRVLDVPGEADRLRQAGTRRVAEFTWQRSARETLAALRRAYAQHTAAGATR